MNRPAVAAARDAVFVSYSHDDQDWRRKFTLILAPLVRSRRLELWDDTHIPTGGDWRRDIDDGVRRAGTALLLVTGSYLASRFVMEEELPALVAHGVRLVPVLVEDCLWDQEPLLAAVQWAHDPGREGPLAAADPREVLGRIVRTCRALLQVAPVVGPPRRPAGPIPVGALPDRVEALAPGLAGPLHGVPGLPSGYLERAELGGLRAALLGAGAVGVIGDGHALGMYGQGGIGKTVLAAATARDPVVRAYFPDGVFWVTAGEQLDLAGLQASLLSRLGAAGPVPRSAAEGAGLLRQALAGRQLLLVVDDVWSAAAAQAFRVTGLRGRVLYTTRDPAVLAAAGAVAERVGVLPEAAARQLLARLAELPEGALPPEADRVLAATGQVALGLALAGAAVRGGATWPQVAGELDRGGDTFLDHPYANTFKALQAATAALDPGLAAAYASLAVFPPDTRVPVAAVSRYWGRLRGVPPEQVHAELEMLADRELLVLNWDGIAFHDLQHSYLLLQADDLALLHDGLLAGYRALLASPGTGWWRLPAEEPYIWDHLLYHLLGAGDRSEAASTMTDLAFLARRIALAGPHAAETDLAQAAGVHLDDPRIGWLRRWLARHAHVLAGLVDPADVAVTLAGWLASPPAGIDCNRLDPLLPSPYPAPRWGLPAEPPAALQRVLSGHAGWVTAVAFSPDGRRLASTSDDGTVRIWDPDAGAQLASLTGHYGPVYAVAFSSDGRRLASASDDGTVRIWDPDGGAQLASLTGHTSRVTAVAFSPDGRRLASASDDATVRIGDPATGVQLAALTGHYGPVTAVAFSPDGRRPASAGDDGTVRLWDPATGAQLAAPTDYTSRVDAVAFSPDGRRLASAGEDGTVRIWDPGVGAGRVTLSGHDGWVTAVAFSPDGRRLASASEDGTVRIWAPATGAQLAALTGHYVPVTAVAFSPDGRRLASAGDDGTVRIWDPDAGAQPAILTGHRGPVYAVAFSPDGRQLASAGEDGTVRIWDPGVGAGRVTLSGHDGWVTAVAFSPDGRRLASASEDGTVRIWAPATGAQLAALTGHYVPVTAVAFSPDGRRLASAGDDGTVRIWDPDAGAQPAILTGHRGPVYAVAFSPDGRQLASASDDRTVRIWDPDAGAQSAILTGHRGPVSGVAFSPDGRRLASAGDDGTVRLWDGKAAGALSLLQLDAPIWALTWGRKAIALGKGVSVVLLDVVTHK